MTTSIMDKMKFEKISMQDAIALAAFARKGIYLKIKTEVLDRVRDEEQSGKPQPFLFGDGEEIEENQAAGVKTAIVKGLKDANCKFSWRVKWLLSKKMFVCIPQPKN